MLARASTKTFVSRVRKTAKKNLRWPKNSLAGSLVSRGITVYIYIYIYIYIHTHIYIYIYIVYYPNRKVNLKNELGKNESAVGGFFEEMT